jgi:hypothetical protein
MSTLTNDERLKWTAAVILKSLKWVDDTSVKELFARDGAIQEILKVMENADINKSSVIIFSAAEGDSFESEGEQILHGSDDDEDDELKCQKLRHQRLQLSTTFICSGNVSGTNQQEAVRCVFLVKINPVAITEEDAHGWSTDPDAPI